VLIAHTGSSSLLLIAQRMNLKTVAILAEILCGFEVYTTVTLCNRGWDLHVTTDRGEYMIV
jgi:hypothetical protein